MSLFEELKFTVEHNMSPNQTRLTQATELWLRVLCNKIEDRLNSLKDEMENKIEDLRQLKKEDI